MPTLDNWFNASGAFAISASARAADAWRRIQDKPTSITLVRNGSDLAAQTVRLEYDNTSNDTEAGGAGKSSKRSLTVFGVKGHATVADTNILRSDRFAINGVKYQVIDVIYSIGELQAKAEVSA